MNLVDRGLDLHDDDTTSKINGGQGGLPKSENGFSHKGLRKCSN